MATAGSLSVVIPLHDEAAAIPALARRMREFVAAETTRRAVDLVLVDDGSADGTHDLLVQNFDGLPHTLLRHRGNRGLTAALATGNQAARGELIAWLDSDLTYDPDVLSALALAVDQGADIAVASCYHPDGAVEGVAGWRLLLSSAASRAYRRLTGCPIYTFTCMVRVYRRAVLDDWSPRQQGFLGVTEVLVAAIRRGIRAAELPPTLSRRRLGHSKMRVLRVGLGHLRLMGRVWRRTV